MLRKIDQEFDKVKNGLDQQKIAELKANYESSYSDMFYDTQFLGEMLATNHFFFGNAKNVNKIIDNYMSVSNEEIKTVARKYFVPANRKIIIYHPEK